MLNLIKQRIKENKEIQIKKKYCVVQVKALRPNCLDGEICD